MIDAIKIQGNKVLNDLVIENQTHQKEFEKTVPIMVQFEKYRNPKDYLQLKNTSNLQKQVKKSQFKQPTRKISKQKVKLQIKDSNKSNIANQTTVNTTLQSKCQNLTVDIDLESCGIYSDLDSSQEDPRLLKYLANSDKSSNDENCDSLGIFDDSSDEEIIKQLQPQSQEIIQSENKNHLNQKKKQVKVRPKSASIQNKNVNINHQKCLEEFNKKQVSKNKTLARNVSQPIITEKMVKVQQIILQNLKKLETQKKMEQLQQKIQIKEKNAKKIALQNYNEELRQMNMPKSSKELKHYGWGVDQRKFQKQKSEKSCHRSRSRKQKIDFEQEFKVTQIQKEKSKSKQMAILKEETEKYIKLQKQTNYDELKSFQEKMKQAAEQLMLEKKQKQMQEFQIKKQKKLEIQKLQAKQREILKRTKKVPYVPKDDSFNDDDDIKQNPTQQNIKTLNEEVIQQNEELKQNQEKEKHLRSQSTEIKLQQKSQVQELRDDIKRKKIQVKQEEIKEKEMFNRIHLLTTVKDGQPDIEQNSEQLAQMMIKEGALQDMPRPDKKVDQQQEKSKINIKKQIIQEIQSSKKQLETQKQLQLEKLKNEQLKQRLKQQEEKQKNQLLRKKQQDELNAQMDLMEQTETYKSFKLIQDEVIDTMHQPRPQTDNFGLKKSQKPAKKKTIEPVYVDDFIKLKIQKLADNQKNQINNNKPNLSFEFQKDQQDGQFPYDPSLEYDPNSDMIFKLSAKQLINVKDLRVR